MFRGNERVSTVAQDVIGETLSIRCRIKMMSLMSTYDDLSSFSSFAAKTLKMTTLDPPLVADVSAYPMRINDEETNILPRSP